MRRRIVSQKIEALYNFATCEGSHSFHKETLFALKIKSNVGVLEEEFFYGDLLNRGLMGLAAAPRPPSALPLAVMGSQAGRGEGQTLGRVLPSTPSRGTPLSPVGLITPPTQPPQSVLRTLGGVGLGWLGG